MPYRAVDIKLLGDIFYNDSSDGQFNVWYLHKTVFMIMGRFILPSILVPQILLNVVNWHFDGGNNNNKLWI